MALRPSLTVMSWKKILFRTSHVAGDMEGFNTEITMPRITPRIRAVTMRLTKLFRFFSTMISTPVYNRNLYPALEGIRKFWFGGLNSGHRCQQEYSCLNCPKINCLSGCLKGNISKDF